MNLDGSSTTDLQTDLFGGQLDFGDVKQETSFMADDELGLDSFNIINYTSEPPPLISEASLCGNMSITDASMAVVSPLSVSSQLSPPMMAPLPTPVPKQTSVLQHHLLEAEAQIRSKKIPSMQSINTVKVCYGMVWCNFIRHRQLCNHCHVKCKVIT